MLVDATCPVCLRVALAQVLAVMRRKKVHRKSVSDGLSMGEARAVSGLDPD